MTRATPSGGVWATLGRAAAVGLASLAMAVVRFRVWEQSFSVPLVTAGTDDLQIAAIVKSIRDTGWYFTNPDLGAPFGQQLYDFPHAGEALQLVAIKFLTLFSVRPFWVMNVYFLAGFAAVAFVTYLVLVHLRFSAGVSAAVAILYTWLPYHFMHGQFHLFRSAYLSAPLGVLVIFWVLSWKDRFLVDADGPVWGPAALRANLRWPRVWAAVGLCVVVGAYETMVMAFVLVTLIVTALVAALRNRDVGDLAAAVAAGAIIAATFGLLFIPNYAYKASHGPNTEAAARIPAEQVMYGLHISKMVLPVSEHPVGPLGRLMPRSQHDNPVPGEAGQNLGLLGALGLLGLFYGVIVNRFDTRAGRQPWDRHRLWVQSGAASLVLVLFATLSGFALVLSVFGFSQIRVWGRASIVIAFFAYVAVASGLERVVARVRGWVSRRAVSSGSGSGASATGPAGGRARGRSWAGGAAGVLLVAVTVFGLWDTTVAYSSSRTNASQDRRATVLMELDGAVRATLGPEPQIFQLPVVPYPESTPVHGMADYEEFLPYLYSADTSYSYGATRGRPDADWQQRVDSDDPVPHLAGLEGLGFDAVLVDTTGYRDVEALAGRLDAALGDPVVVTRGGRWQVWDLRGYGERAGLDADALRAAAIDLVGAGMYGRLVG